MNKIGKDFNNITSGVLVFNKEKDRVLLIRRPSDVIFPNTYSIPGGRIKQNESIESAALRELYEETNITIYDYSYLKSYFYGDVCLFVFITICEGYEEKMIPIDDIEEIKLAPNIETAIKDALNYFDTFCYDLQYNIKNICDDIISRVAENKIEINGKIGFDHFLCQQRIGTLGSAIGLNILSRTSNYSNLKNQVLSNILDSQLPDGGWGIKSHDNKESLLESTCYSLQAIANFEEAKEARDAAIKWLFENRLEDCSWGANASAQKGKVTSTCLALRTLYCVGITEDLEGSVNWLFESQNLDGGWGFEKDFKSSNVTATSLAILTLCLLTDKANNKIKKAISWLDAKLNDSKISEESEVSYLGDRRFEYKHSTTIYALSALVSFSGIGSIKPSLLLHYISEIIKKRNSNGFWEHESTPGYFPIWHTYNILNYLSLIIETSGVLTFNYFKIMYERYRFQMDYLECLKKNLASFHNYSEQNIIY